MSRRRALAGVAAFAAIVVAGWVVPWAVTDPGSAEDRAAVDLVDLVLEQWVREVLTVGHDVYVVSDPERRRVNECEPAMELRRIVARTWWFIPLTTYEVGCNRTWVVGGV